MQVFFSKIFPSQSNHFLAVFLHLQYMALMTLEFDKISLHHADFQSELVSYMYEILSIYGTLPPKLNIHEHQTYNGLLWTPLFSKELKLIEFLFCKKRSTCSKCSLR